MLTWAGDDETFLCGYLSSVCVSSVTSIQTPFSLLSNWIIIFLTVEFLSVLDMNPLSDLWFVSIFSQLKTSFYQTEVLNSDEVQLNCFNSVHFALI